MNLLWKLLNRSELYRALNRGPWLVGYINVTTRLPDANGYGEGQFVPPIRPSFLSFWGVVASHTRAHISSV